MSERNRKARESNDREVMGLVQSSARRTARVVNPPDQPFQLARPPGARKKLTRGMPPPRATDLNISIPTGRFVSFRGSKRLLPHALIKRIREGGSLFSIPIYPPIGCVRSSILSFRFVSTSTKKARRAIYRDSICIYSYIYIYIFFSFEK